MTLELRVIHSLLLRQDLLLYHLIEKKAVRYIESRMQTDAVVIRFCREMMR